MKTERAIQDPLGNNVLVDDTICNLQHYNLEEIYDDVIAVIEKPALVFRIENGTIEHFYYRSIGWNKTLMVIAQKIQQYFHAKECIVDPTKTFMASIFEKGEQLI